MIGWADGRMTMALAFVLCLASPATAIAQEVTTPPIRPSAHPLIHTGKWIALGGAVALGVVAESKHRDADRAYRELRSRCFDSPDACIVGPGGAYIDPTSEGLYQDTRSSDRQATRLLIGAEVALLGAATGFIWELMQRRDRPPTIPFEPHVASAASATHVGLSFRF